MKLQNRALHCYLLMSIWILLLVAGIYKYFEAKQEQHFPIASTTELFSNLGLSDLNIKRILKICNFPEDIAPGDEGVLDSDSWVLKGVLIVIRHGDRGPLQHVKKINHINCNTNETSLLTSYKNYLYNLTITGKIQWTGQGPFHGFPVLPTYPHQCLLGQLTMQGISQLLNMGRILRTSYSGIWSNLRNIQPENVLVYSTRYRRTFQSALAFLYDLIPHETLSKLSIHESQSMSFCFRDCGCPLTESLIKNVKKSIALQLKSHPAIVALTESTGKTLFSTNAEHKTFTKDPHAVRDALLSFICHRNGLPCDSPHSCIKRHHIAGILTYTDWVNHQKWRNIYWRQYCLLKYYGLIRHIVQQMLYMVSNGSPSLVLYSGHDHTLEQLSAALGLANDPLLLRYGARIVFEVYQDNRQSSQIDAKGIYFRVLSNGKDVTKQISFCRNLVNVVNKNFVCKIEDIVRFLHDDYFSVLNVTNLKDACTNKNNN